MDSKTNQEIADETAKAAVEEVAKAAEAPKLPGVIQLTDAERISGENLNLRMRLLQMEFDAEKRKILDDDRAWTANVGARAGVDLTKYAIDFASGTAILANGIAPKAGN